MRKLLAIAGMIAFAAASVAALDGAAIEQADLLYDDDQSAEAIEILEAQLGAAGSVARRGEEPPGLVHVPGEVLLVHSGGEINEGREHGLRAAVGKGLDHVADQHAVGRVERHGSDPATAEMLRDTVIANVGGQPITLAHVASVRPDFEDISYFSRINGENVITLNVTKRSGQNSISVSRRLRHELPQIEAEAPFPVTFEVDQDEGEDLEDKLEELVIRSLVILGLLFILLLLISL